MILSLIVAVSENGVIGSEGRLPWRLPADLARFKAITLGHSVIMGRKTFASIGRPLPGRRNLVVSRQVDDSPPGVEVVASLADALDRCRAESEVFVIGGASLYAAALPQAQRLYLTLVQAHIEGDVTFPLLNASHWRLVSEEFRPADEDHAYPLCFKLYERD